MSIIESLDARFDANNRKDDMHHHTCGLLRNSGYYIN